MASNDGVLPVKGGPYSRGSNAAAEHGAKTPTNVSNGVSCVTNVSISADIDKSRIAVIESE